MKIAVMQHASVCADVKKNLEAVQSACEVAKKQGARLLLTPYQVLTGYPLGDLIVHDFLYDELEKAYSTLLKVEGIAILFSYFKRIDGKVYVSHTVIDEGKCIYDWTYLWSGRQTDNPTELPSVLQLEGYTIGLSTESIGYDVTSTQLDKVDFLIYHITTPFYVEWIDHLAEDICALAKKTSTPVCCLRPLGANDELIFEGSSLLVNADAQVIFQAPYFEKHLEIAHFQKGEGFSITQPKSEKIFSRPELLYRAIVFSLKSYLQKVNIKKVCLGLSGGIDSALVLAIAVEAIGAENCKVLLLPSQYSRSISAELASQMASGLGVEYFTIGIQSLFEHYLKELSPIMVDKGHQDLMEENLQARIRGVLLMALSNYQLALLLATGNKSESAAGYCTLYGDTNGGFAPIKDLFKTEVYEIARWLNDTKGYPLIPVEIINRPPSAELRPGQTDQDSLPDYSQLDAITSLILDNYSLDYIVEQGYEKETVKQVMNLIRNSEFKRKQGVIGPKLSRRSLGGEDWHYPITYILNDY